MQLIGVNKLVKRAKHSPLNIHCDVSYESDSLRIQMLITYIARRKIVRRWKNLSWTSSETVMGWMIDLLNSPKFTSFPNLVSLSLSSRTKYKVLEVPTAGAVGDFPALTHVCLARVLPEELPPAVFPKLQTLYIYFSVYSYHVHPFPRMSGLLSLLSRAQELEQVTLDEAVPVMDVELVPPTSSATSAIPSFVGSRRAPKHVEPIPMSRVTTFSWYHSPPEDLWRFFHFVPMTNLRTLHLLLDSPTFRWQQESDNHTLTDMSSQNELSTHPILSAMIQLPKLENLVLEFLYRNTLNICFRRFLVPALKSLSLAYVPKDMAQGDHLPAISPPDSIFCDPAMPNLTTLSISNLDLLTRNIRPFLEYAPSLHTLSFERCHDIPNLLGLLTSTSNNAHHQIGPHISHLSFIECSDLDSKVLTSLVSSRNVGPPQPHLGRAVKPLRRRAIATSSLAFASDPAGSSSSANANDPRPSRIKMIHVEGCKKIEEKDIIAFKDSPFDVETVSWKSE